MTDEQFEKLMKKLDEIEQEMKKPDGTWQPLFQPAPAPPQYPWDGLPLHWQWQARD